MTSLVDEIRGYIVAEFLDGEDTAELTSDFDLINSGVVDSLGVVRIVSHISRTYSIPTDDIPLTPDGFRSIGAISAFVENATKTAA
ncbi:phosphopantetheine-binding protein [Microbispora hainanensis]|jgi:acyl carrier protein|uniref:Phosphopantetheine-binding protein n=1 Tax=Microbispora hainanensis TaxID=568844 RepID=A0ABZ1SKM3_9ACTN|nr:MULTISPECIES: phosphopantetheine-binding protein [Microbispora]NJP29350.1 acyl carrier protein [Microbispora sp. CL1-1]TQS05431.1 acyl carrier protein [Microbispora sp. SCL1-1]